MLTGNEWKFKHCEFFTSVGFGRWHAGGRQNGSPRCAAVEVLGVLAPIAANEREIPSLQDRCWCAVGRRESFFKSPSVPRAPTGLLAALGGRWAFWGHLGAPWSSSRRLAATTRAGTSVEKTSPPVVLVPRHNRANSRDGHSYLFLPRSQWKFHNTFMTLDAPQWPECAGPEVKEAGGKKMIDSEPAKSTRWNGAEQLFSAAKAYGIRCCFANPGTSDDRTPWGVFDSTSFVHILRSFPSSSSTRSRPTA